MTVEMKQIVERYKKLYSGVVYDSLAALGYPNQSCSYDIKPIRDDMVLAGPAFTIKGKALDTKLDAEIKRKEYLEILNDMVNAMTDPCVLVMDTGTDTRCTYHGEMFAHSARAHGATGALVDGGIRDSRFLLDVYPVFRRYQSAVELQREYMFEYYQKPVQIRGSLVGFVTVNPGDFIFGDLDGAFVVPKELIIKVLEKAEEQCNLETRQREDAKTGMALSELFKKYGAT